MGLLPVSSDSTTLLMMDQDPTRTVSRQHKIFVAKRKMRKLMLMFLLTGSFMLVELVVG